MAVPAATPLTRPIPVTVATAEGKLLHDPPVDVSVSVEEPCTHKVAIPVIPAGDVKMLSVLVTVQPVPSE